MNSQKRKSMDFSAQMRVLVIVLACLTLLVQNGIAQTESFSQNNRDPFEKTIDPLDNFPEKLKKTNLLSNSDQESKLVKIPLFSLLMQTKKNVPLAIFRRGRNLWIVIKTPNAFSSSDITEAASRYIRRLEDISTKDETILRLIIDERYNPSIDFAEIDTKPAMLLNFYEQPMFNDREISVEVEVDRLNGSPYILIADRQGNDIIEVIDSEIGQRIIVMPTEVTNYGIPKMHQFPDVTIFPSLQGSALLLKRSDIRVRQYDFGFTVSSEQDLNISVNENTTQRDLRNEQLRFLDAEEWVNVPPGKIIGARDELLFRIVKSPVQKRSIPRAKLVRFFLSLGWGAEALSVLEYAGEQNSSYKDTHEYISYQTAGNYFMRRYEEVEAQLNAPNIAEFRDSQIWSAAIHAHHEEWTEAFTDFQASESILRRYPVYLRIEFGLLYLRAALAVKRYNVASVWIDVLKKHINWFTPFQKNSLNYIEGQLALAQNDWAKARFKFDLVAQEDDLHNQLNARYALISMDRRELDLSDEAAIKRMKQLRADARQTNLEVVILQQMVDVMLLKRDYLAAMRLMRLMTTLDIGAEFNRDLVSRMQSTLNDLFLDLESQRSILPIRNIAIFDEFRELTPVGEKGNRIINGLIQNLVQMDLLDQAEDMLAYQIRYRVYGEEKVRLGMKLAVVALLNNNASLALKSLNETQFGLISQELGRHRRLLRAKALANLGEIDQALKQLAGDITMPADLIRREIFWKEKDWTELAKTIRRLITSLPNEEGKLSELQARYVLNWIVALQMRNDTVGVQEVVNQYREEMLRSRYAPVFSFLVADNKRNSQDAIQRVLSEGEIFTEFLDTYQNELLGDNFDNFVLEDIDDSISQNGPA